MSSTVYLCAITSCMEHESLLGPGKTVIAVKCMEDDGTEQKSVGMQDKEIQCKDHQSTHPGQEEGSNLQETPLHDRPMTFYPHQFFVGMVLLLWNDCTIYCGLVVFVCRFWQFLQANTAVQSHWMCCIPCHAQVFYRLYYATCTTACKFVQYDILKCTTTL